MFIILKLYIQIDNIDDHKQNINIKLSSQIRPDLIIILLFCLYSETLRYYYSNYI